MSADRKDDVVYIPVARSLLPSFRKWSGPVEFRIDAGKGRYAELVVRKLEAPPPPKRRKKETP